MLPQEREILNNFLDRFNRLPQQTPDPEANALIHQALRRPDAAYLLVQQALIQEIGLRQAEQRIQQLEQELQAARSNTASAPASGGSFLGGMMGGGRRGGWSDAPIPPPPASPSYSAWGSAPAPGQRGGGVGGFLASAAATAAGVAGGALLFEGVKNFMGSSNATEENAGGLFSDFIPNAQNENTDISLLPDTNLENDGWLDNGEDTNNSGSSWI